MALFSHAGASNARAPGWAAMVALIGAFTHRSKTVSIEKKNNAASPTAKYPLTTLAGYFALGGE
jgi:hypothetical protein